VPRKTVNRVAERWGLTRLTTFTSLPDAFFVFIYGQEVSPFEERVLVTILRDWKWGAELRKGVSCANVARTIGGTGAARGNVRRALYSLSERGVVTFEEGGPGKPTIIGIEPLLEGVRRVDLGLYRGSKDTRSGVKGYSLGGQGVPDGRVSLDPLLEYPSGSPVCTQRQSSKTQTRSGHGWLRSQTVTESKARAAEARRTTRQKLGIARTIAPEDAERIVANNRAIAERWAADEARQRRGEGEA